MGSAEQFAERVPAMLNIDADTDDTKSSIHDMMAIQQPHRLVPVGRPAFPRSIAQEEETMIAIRTNSRLHSVLAAGMLALMLVSTAQAAQDPNAFVAQIGTQGIQSLGRNVSSTERLTRLRSLFQQDFDIAGIGLFALGRYRWSATPEEQQQFFALYPDFTIRNLSSRLDEFGGAQFRVTGRRDLGGEIVVNSEVTRADGSRAQLDWHLTGNDGNYRITDVAVGGVSMKIALRDQFASWIQSNGAGFRGLLAVLRQQTAQAR